MISTVLFFLALVAASYAIIAEIIKYRKSSVMRLDFYGIIGLSLVIIGLIILESVVLVGKILIYSGAAIAVLGTLALLIKSNRKKTKKIK